VSNVKEPVGKCLTISVVVHSHILIEVKYFNVLPDVRPLDSRVNSSLTGAVDNDWKCLLKVTSEDSGVCGCEGAAPIMFGRQGREQYSQKAQNRRPASGMGVKETL